MLKNKPLLLAAALTMVTALASFSAQAFWGPFNMFRGWGGGPWWGGYPYYGYPYYGYPYYGYGAPYWPHYGGWGYPYYGGWGAPYLTYPAAPAATSAPASETAK